jgi:hypothetical protein
MRAMLEASAVRRMHVLCAVTKNQATRARHAHDMFRRHVRALARELAQLHAMNDARGAPPPKPWWHRLAARVNLARIQLGRRRKDVRPVEGRTS